MNILFVAPASFPIKSSECISNAKIAFILANMGHKIDVISIDDFDYAYPKEHNLFLHENLCIHSVKTPKWIQKPNILMRILRRPYCYFIRIVLGYYYVGNYTPYFIYRYIVKNLLIKKYDVLITRVFGMEVVGIFLSKYYHIPWIANWNDPTKFPPPYGKGPFAKMTRSAMKIQNDTQIYATVHTYPSKRLRDYMMQYMNKIKLENTFVIPHSALSMLSPVGTCSFSKLRIIHAGNVGKPRDPRTFLTALSKVAHNPKYINKISCDFVGIVSSEFTSLVSFLGLESNVNFFGTMSYQTLIKIQTNYNMSLIIEADCEEGIYLPTKVADSIQAGLPIFCISPIIGTLHDIISEYHNGYFADVRSVDDIENQLINAINDFENNRLPIINKETLACFFEDEIQNDYNTIFNQILKKG